MCSSVNQTYKGSCQEMPKSRGTFSFRRTDSKIDEEKTQTNQNSTFCIKKKHTNREEL